MVQAPELLRSTGMRAASAWAVRSGRTNCFFSAITKGELGLALHVEEAYSFHEKLAEFTNRIGTGSEIPLAPGGMGGKEALKKLIEIDPTVNAIVSSGYATDATMSRYQDFGFRGMIAKPYEAAELGKIVHDVISSSHVNYNTEEYDGGRLASRVA